MESGGGGTTTVEQDPPQLLPEGREGYNLAQQYYQNILRGNPPIYEGPRVAPINPTQREYMEQGRNYFGRRQNFQISAEDQANRTSSGDYLYDPNEEFGYDPSKAPFYIGNEGDRYSTYYGPRENLSDISLIKQGIGLNSRSSPTATGASANYNPSEGWTKPSDIEIQKYVESASQPYLRHLEEDTLPGIQSDFGVAGGGVNNTREQLTKQAAIRDNSELIANDVVAGVFKEMEALDQQFKNAERDREAAIADGDANRATQASIASAEIASRMLELDNQLRMRGSELSTQGIQASARNVLEMTEGERNRRLAATEGAQERNLKANVAQNQNRLDAWNSERGRMLDSVGQTENLLRSESIREMMLQQIGDYERAFQKENIEAQRAAWAEPIQMQSSAANALFGASGMGPGSAQSMVEKDTDVLGSMMQMISMAAMIYMMA